MQTFAISQGGDAFRFKVRFVNFNRLSDVSQVYLLDVPAAVFLNTGYAAINVSTEVMLAAGSAYIAGGRLYMEYGTAR